MILSWRADPSHDLLFLVAAEVKKNTGKQRKKQALICGACQSFYDLGTLLGQFLLFVCQRRWWGFFPKPKNNQPFTPLERWMEPTAITHEKKGSHDLNQTCLHEEMFQPLIYQGCKKSPQSPSCQFLSCSTMTFPV